MRLSHALGVSHLAGRIARHVLAGLPEVGDRPAERRIRLLEAAGMLHDIGHTPWSHTLEPLYLEVSGQDHMGLVADLVTGRARLDIEGAGTVPDILSGHGVDPAAVADLICSRYGGEPYLQQMIFGEVDADMLDYLQRDFHFTGVAFGHIEVDRLISTMVVHDGRLMFLAKGLDAVRDFLHARLQMYSSVYLHKKTRIVDQMLLRAARRSIVELEEVPSFWSMTDDELLSFLCTGSKDPWVREMAWRVKYRQGLFSRVFRIDAATSTETEKGFLRSLAEGGEEPAGIASSLESEIAREAGTDSRQVIVDLPLEAVKVSEERFTRLDIRFLDKSGRVLGLEELDPAFGSYLMRAVPNRSLLTISCAPEHRERVRKACRTVFGRMASPLFGDGTV
jgi:hypothetical protein